MHTYNLFTYIYFLIDIYISIFKNVAIWKYILNICTFSLPSRRDEKRKGIYIQYIFSNIYIYFFSNIYIYIFSNIYMCIYTYIWSRKRETQSHRKVVLLISSTFKYTYIYIYIYIYIYYPHPSISTALMRPRRPKQYCLQLVIYIYIYIFYIVLFLLTFLCLEDIS